MSSPSVVACPACGKKNRVPPAASGTPVCGSCKRPLPWSVEADDTSFGSAVLSSPLPVLVDLWAPWCGPCRMVSPAVQAMAQRYAGRLKVAKVNVDESPATARRYQAMSIPTLLMVKDGSVAARQVGAIPEQQLDAWVQHALVD